jgi:hypothetical protein
MPNASLRNAQCSWSPEYIVPGTLPVSQNASSDVDIARISASTVGASPAVLGEAAA